MGVQMNLVLLGVNILLVLVIWRFMVKRTVLDHTRDKLFDLRDEVRETFIAREWDLGSPAYKKLRDLLNGHLRFTEDYSIWKVAYLSAAIEKNPHLEAEMQAKFEKTFTSNIPDQLEYMHAVRKRSRMAVMEFTVFGSGFLIFLSVVISPVVLLLRIVEVLSRGLDVAVDVGGRSVHNVGKVVASLISSTTSILSRRLFRSDWLEPYNYKIGSA